MVKSAGFGRLRSAAWAGPGPLLALRDRATLAIPRRRQARLSPGWGILRYHCGLRQAFHDT
jgi:hypothetical protein